MDKEFVSSLIGAISGGVLAWVGSYFSLRKQYLDNIKINNKSYELKEKSIFLTLDDELEENKIIINGYIDFMQANIRNKIDLRTDNVNKVNDEAWKQVRQIIFLSKNINLVKRLSDFYKGIYIAQYTDIIEKQLVESLLNDCINARKQIKIHLDDLEKSS